MKNNNLIFATVIFLLASLWSIASTAPNLTLLSTYISATRGEGVETVSVQSSSKLLALSNRTTNTVEILSIEDPTNPKPIKTFLLQVTTRKK